MSNPRIAINGFGRIGRTVFRILNDREDVDVVGLNDLSELEQLAYLCRYDTVHGRFPGSVTLEGGRLKAGRQDVQVLKVSDPAQLPW